MGTEDYDIWVDLDTGARGYEIVYSHTDYLTPGSRALVGDTIQCGDEDGCRALGKVVRVDDNGLISIELDWSTFNDKY